MWNNTIQKTFIVLHDVICLHLLLRQQNQPEWMHKQNHIKKRKCLSERITMHTSALKIPCSKTGFLILLTQHCLTFTFSYVIVVESKWARFWPWSIIRAIRPLRCARFPFPCLFSFGSARPRRLVPAHCLKLPALPRRKCALKAGLVQNSSSALHIWKTFAAALVWSALISVQHRRWEQTCNLDANQGICEVLFSRCAQTGLVSPGALIQFEELPSTHFL